MKSAIAALPLALSLVACGSVDSTVSAPSNEVAPTTRTTNRALNESREQLTDARKEVLAAAYLALDESELDAANELTVHFGSDALFVKLSVSDILPVRLSRPITLLIPAGTESEPSNPNRADEFYVEHGSTATLRAAVYGPFPLLGQEGSPCGGIAGAAFRCADGLECQTEATHPDASGTCEVSAK